MADKENKARKVTEFVQGPTASVKFQGYYDSKVLIMLGKPCCLG